MISKYNEPNDKFSRIQNSKRKQTKSTNNNNNKKEKELIKKLTCH